MLGNIPYESDKLKRELIRHIFIQKLESFGGTTIWFHRFMSIKKENDVKT